MFAMTTFLTQNRRFARCNRKDYGNRDLRIGSSPLRRLHAGNGEGRHTWPRTDGQSRRGRQRREELDRWRPRGGALHDRLWRMFFLQKGAVFLLRYDQSRRQSAAKLMGHAPAGLFGYSHLTGHYPGGQAEYLRVPHADVSPLKIENDSLSDEQVLFLSDIFPTGYMAAENAQIEPGDTVAIWGCGPVGQFTIQSAWMFGAGRVIAIDRVPERLRMAEEKGKAEVINFEKVDGSVYDRLQEMTKGRGPDSCIDAVGAEAHGSGSFDAVMDKAKAAVFLATDRAHVLREAIMCCRKGGTVSIPGVYGGFLDKVPMGAAMNKGLTMKMGQTHVKRYTRPLLDRINAGDIDPSFVITHNRPLEEGPELYKTFRDKRDGCIKVVLKA